MTDRRELPYAFRDIRERLQQRVPALVERLGIRERAVGGVVTPLNPTRTDRRPGSFVIWIQGEAPGSWCDYATGEKGDVLDLIQYLGRLKGRLDAYWFALDFLGLQRGTWRTADAAQQDRERFERERRAAEARAAVEIEGRRVGLFKHWLSLPEIKGTVAETYLVEARGIDLSLLRHYPGALRFEASADHLDEETGELTSWPCMVALMTRGDRGGALHRTFLMPDGSGKAPVKGAKKIYGRGLVKGAAIRLTRGLSGMSPGKAAAAGRNSVLVLGEGIETSLTGGVARPDYRAWAAGTLGNLSEIDWPPDASGVVLLKDNDPGAQAQAAFAKAEAHWRETANGRPVKVVAAAVGKDFNDWVRA